MAGAALLVLAGVAAPARAPAQTRFQDPLDNRPLDIPLPEGPARTPAIEQFHATGTTPYRGDAAAREDGRAIWAEYCQACHMPDGTGRIGPNLVDGEALRSRANTDKGQFEILWAGAAGAMQSFRDRLSQDQMLRVMAYIDQLRERAGAPR